MSLPLIATVIANSSPAEAQFSQPPGTSVPTSPISSVQQIKPFLTTLLSWGYFFFFFLTAVFVLWAAFDYLTAGGDEKKLASAKNKILYAVVAVVIALIATGINAFVGSFFNVSVPSPTTP
ncbi:MAG: hypothetical protein M1153_00290 [Patescibacteria group bacterium]|nr:hypothetical protein [Patescibacteria group bacterium]